jgi:hypothetical protein
MIRHRDGFILSFLFASLFLAACAESSRAAIMSYSHLKVNDFRFFVDTGGGTPGAPIQQGVHVNIITAATSSAASANVASVAGGPVSTSNFVLGSDTGSDTLQAYEGAGVAPAQNTFSMVNAAGNVPHARADTAGSGVMVAGTGFAFGAALELVSEVNLSANPTVSDFGKADSSTNNTATFTVVPLVPLNIVATFTGARDLVADLTPFPPGVIASASMSMSLTVDEVGIGKVFEFTPDGVAGGVFGGVQYSDPFTLNGAASTFPGATNSASSAGGLFSAGFTLQPGRAYSFAAVLNTSATAATLGVPEPTTAGFALTLLAAACIARRRK